MTNEERNDIIEECAKVAEWWEKAASYQGQTPINPTHSESAAPDQRQNWGPCPYCNPEFDNCKIRASTKMRFTITGAHTECLAEGCRAMMLYAENARLLTALKRAIDYIDIIGETPGVDDELKELRAELEKRS